DPIETKCVIRAILASTHIFFSGRRRHTRSKLDWSSDVCTPDLRRAATSSSRVIFPVVSMAARTRLRRAFARSGRKMGKYPVGERSEERRVGKEGINRGRAAPGR